MSTVRCDTYGAREERFVCGHLTLDAVGLGFWQAEDCAWCDACERRRIDVGGDWVGVAGEALDAKLVCDLCFETIRSDMR